MFVACIECYHQLSEIKVGYNSNNLLWEETCLLMFYGKIKNIDLIWNRTLTTYWLLVWTVSTCAKLNSFAPTRSHNPTNISRLILAQLLSISRDFFMNSPSTYCIRRSKTRLNDFLMMDSKFVISMLAQRVLQSDVVIVVTQFDTPDDIFGFISILRKKRWIQFITLFFIACGIEIK